MPDEDTQMTAAICCLENQAAREEIHMLRPNANMVLLHTETSAAT